MSEIPVRYQSADEDSQRWAGFPFRAGDIVISTRSKSGTTWAQMICALLIFQRTELPARLADLSPWLDFLVTPKNDVYEQLAAQTHRRFIKTHTPLDGVPADDRVTYIVVARHPLDMAVSLYHQSANIDRERMRLLTGQPMPTSASTARPPLHDWLLEWIRADRDPRESLDSLQGVIWHVADAWRRRDRPNVLLLHYGDLAADLGGQMRQISHRLGIDVPDDRWHELVQAATFESMRERSQQLIPGAAGILKNPAAFFRRGSPGAGREVLSDAEFAEYQDRVAALGPADLVAWLHRS
ncbi:MAG TPA: sulfotransferase domain-containing protein [Galbitalea sp.]